MTIDRNNLKEAELSQVPAIHLLWNMGWNYITEEQALVERGGRFHNLLLEKTLREQLKKLNGSDKNKDGVSFSEANFDNAINELKNVPYEGLISTSEKIYDLITLGKSYEVRPGQSYDMKYIDWENPENNVYHVTDEFKVEKKSVSGEHRIPDLVLFINGIPVVVIECKDDAIFQPIQEAVKQNIRNSKADEIPQLMAFAQVTMGIAPLRVLTEEDFQKNQDYEECMYATTGTPLSFWFPWRERELNKSELEGLVNKPLSDDKWSMLFDGTRYQHVKDHYLELISKRRTVTQQDQILYSMLKPHRLFELILDFIMFDGGHKKIARYQQYYSVKAAIRRITSVNDTRDNRPSGLIWHTQGSGKSLNMVLLTKAIARERSIVNRKIIIMTDRKRLDKQISGTFKNCGIPVERATSGRKLIELLQTNKATVIATTMHKFDTVLNEGIKFDSRDIFIPVDEAHRSQSGEAKKKVEKVFPNACFIGYTGTPIAKKGHKNTFVQFGNELIDDPYTVRDALRDKAIVPIRFEGRMVEQEVNKSIMDKFFEDMTAPLNDDQKADLKKQYSRMDHLSKTDQRQWMIALDVKQHAQDWLGTGLKGLLAVDSVESAFKYHKFFQDLGGLKTAVIISKQDDRKDSSTIEEEKADKWYLNMIKERFNGKFEDYEDHEVELYTDNEDDSADILIVVYKLLTGFDAPRCSYLYVDRNLQDHTLLQAFARVNRRFDGKDVGVIIDYRGNVSNLKKAVKEYDSLELKLKGEDANIDFNEEINKTTVEIEEEVAKLDDYLEELEKVFVEVENDKDIQQYEKAIMDKRVRDDFYERLRRYSACLQLALSSRSFYQTTNNEQITEYKLKLSFYQKLRQRAGRIFAEKVDYKDYSPKIEKLLNTHVTAGEVETVVPMFDIYDPNFEEELKKNPKSQALMMANRVKKHIEVNIKRDEFFYKPISEQIEKALEDYREGRIDEAKLLERALSERERIKDRDTGKGVPEVIKDRPHAQAFYGIVLSAFKKFEIETDIINIGNISAKIEDAILPDVTKVDWASNKDLIKKMKDKVEDLLFDFAKEINVEISFDTIDFVLEYVIRTAKERFR